MIRVRKMKMTNSSTILTGMRLPSSSAPTSDI
ncbi:Uncharacterised protein [Vibrio cholerae]|nr:Uncharacterised protein [Vibrio cholerae]